MNTAKQTMGGTDAIEQAEADNTALLASIERGLEETARGEGVMHAPEQIQARQQAQHQAGH